MAINKLTNSASITFNDSDIISNTVDTLMLLAPTIVKSVDITTNAKVGDIVTYTCVITNLSLLSLNPLPFKDVLPTGCQYNTGSFKVDGVIKTPTYTSGTNTLTYTIPSLASLGVTTIVFSVTITG